MKQEWPTTTLGAVLTERREVPTDDDLLSGRVRVVEKISFESGKLSLRGNGATKTGMILVRPGDLLVSGINAAKGAIAIFDVAETQPVAATIHYGAYEVDQRRADVRFLWWMLRSRFFQELLLEYVPGGIKTELKAKRLLPVPVPLPPLAEQRRIVARIDDLSNRVREASALRSRAMDELRVLYAKQVDLAFAPFLDQMVPIGDVFRVTTGGTPSRGNLAYWGGDVKWVSSGEVAFCKIQDTVEKITEAGVKNSNAKVYPPMTVLIAMIGQGKTRGQCAVLDCHAATNQNVAAIHSYETQHDSEYLYWWLFASYQRSRSVETGTAQPALSGDRVKKMLVPLPPLSDQLRVVEQLKAVESSVQQMKVLQAETAAELDALLPSILDKAFSGEL